MKRKTTRLIPFYRGKCLPVALMTLALASANVALAQTNPWVGEALPAVKCPQKVGRVKYYPVIERVRYCTGLFPFNRDLILLLL